jgi:hypothetical protein
MLKVKYLELNPFGGHYGYNRLHHCNFSFFYFTATNAITVTMKANKSKESSTTAAVVPNERKSGQKTNTEHLLAAKSLRKQSDHSCT